MAGSDRGDAHWLLRFGPAEWIRAAQRELTLAVEPGAHRRRSITHLRRAAGMALNAQLVAAHDDGSVSLDDVCRVWGRSYMDHLRALSDDAPLLELPEATREHAGALLSLVFQAGSGGLVSLRTTDSDGLDSARVAARALVDACAT